MDATAELGRNPVPGSKHQIQPEYGDSRLARDGTTDPVSRDQFFRRERGQGKVHFPCSVDLEQDWQPYPVDPYSCYMCDHTIQYNYAHFISIVGVGTRGAYYLVYGDLPRQHPFGTTLRFTGPMSADSRQ